MWSISPSNLGRAAGLRRKPPKDAAYRFAPSASLVCLTIFPLPSYYLPIACEGRPIPTLTDIRHSLYLTIITWRTEKDDGFSLFTCTLARLLAHLPSRCGATVFPQPAGATTPEPDRIATTGHLDITPTCTSHIRHTNSDEAIRRPHLRSA